MIESGRLVDFLGLVAFLAFATAAFAAAVGFSHGEASESEEASCSDDGILDSHRFLF